MNDVYLLKDLAKLSDFSVYTIKYYLKIGLIQEVSRSPETNFRYFDNRTLAQLKKIRQLRRERKSIKTIQAILSEEKKGV